MKFLFIILLTFLSLTSNADTKFYSKFSPNEGSEAFEIIYRKVKTAKKSVYATIYSWSDKGITDSFKEALEQGVEVKIILHPSLAKKSRIKKVAKELEDLGADLKIAKMNMHEKFVLVDNTFVVNSSANMSNTIRNRRLVCSSRCVTNQIGNLIGGNAPNMGTISGSPAAISSIITDTPRPHLTISQTASEFSDMDAVGAIGCTFTDAVEEDNVALPFLDLHGVAGKRREF